MPGCLFQGRLRDRELARQYLVQEVDRQTEPPAVESPHYREACLFSDERDGEGERAHYLSVATSSGTYAQAALLNLI